MREILFRGKRIDNGEWVEGGYRHEKVGEYFTAVFIIEPLTSGVWEHHRVDPSTVGQYTGLTDKHGKRIFEGDIVRFKWDMDCEYCHIIEFVDGEFCATPVLSLENLWSIRICGENKKFTVIGNIHDNPELVKEAET